MHDSLNDWLNLSLREHTTSDVIVQYFLAHKEELNDADFTCLLVVKEILNNSHLVELDHTADLVDLLCENLPVDVASLVNVH